MPSKARLKKIQQNQGGPKKLNSGASKPGVRGAQAPRAPPGSTPVYTKQRPVTFTVSLCAATELHCLVLKS